MSPKKNLYNKMLLKIIDNLLFQNSQLSPIKNLQSYQLKITFHGSDQICWTQDALDTLINLNKLLKSHPAFKLYLRTYLPCEQLDNLIKEETLKRFAQMCIDSKDYTRYEMFIYFSLDYEWVKPTENNQLMCWLFDEKYILQVFGLMCSVIILKSFYLHSSTYYDVCSINALSKILQVSPDLVNHLIQMIQKIVHYRYGDGDPFLQRESRRENRLQMKKINKDVRRSEVIEQIEIVLLESELIKDNLLKEFDNFLLFNSLSTDKISYVKLLCSCLIDTDISKLVFFRDNFYPVISRFSVQQFSFFLHRPYIRIFLICYMISN
jgi:hypothetical protein